MTTRSERGVSIVEATIILAVVALLTAVMAPQMQGYVGRAREARVQEDIRVIGDAINAFNTDNGESQFLRAAHGTNAENAPGRLDANRVELMVSDGDIPTLGSGVATESYWTQAVNNTSVDTLANHLAENTPGDSALNQYRNPTDITIGGGGNNIDFARTDMGGFNAPFSWRGAYLRAPVSPDPWGNRYSVNVAFLDPTPNAAGPVAVANITAGFGTATYPRLDVFVLSAGADEEIDTRSAQDGAVPFDDDTIYIVSSHAK